MISNELVVLNDSNVPVTTSLKVADYFGKKHDNVLKKIRFYIEGGVIGFNETPYVHPQNGQTYPMYEMTRQAWMILVMGFEGPEALKFKQAFVDAFDKMEAELQKPKVALPDFTNPSVAARAWALAYEENLMLEQKITENRPKVEAYDDFLDTSSYKSLTSGLKSIGLRPNRTMQWMRGKYLLSSKRENIPYQRRIEQGLMVLRFVSPANGGNGQYYTQTFLTSKGISHFEKKKLKGELPSYLLADLKTENRRKVA